MKIILNRPVWPMGGSDVNFQVFIIVIDQLTILFGFLCHVVVNVPVFWRNVLPPASG
jgi:hypothetical protein